jgi:hypothetical protein
MPNASTPACGRKELLASQVGSEETHADGIVAGGVMVC